MNVSVTGSNVVSLMVGLILVIMISAVNLSFSRTLSTWFNKIMRADLLVSSAGRIISYQTQPLHEDLGREIVPLISEQFILDRIRNDQDRQHIPLQARVGLFHENLIEAAALMEANIEEPLSLDEAFLKGAQARGMIQLKGHRSVGGMRASIYNAMPIEGVKALVAYMQEFEKQNG